MANIHELRCLQVLLALVVLNQSTAQPAPAKDGTVTIKSGASGQDTDQIQKDAQAQVEATRRAVEKAAASIQAQAEELRKSAEAARNALTKQVNGQAGSAKNVTIETGDDADDADNAGDGDKPDKADKPDKPEKAAKPGSTSNNAASKPPIVYRDPDGTRASVASASINGQRIDIQANESIDIKSKGTGVDIRIGGKTFEQLAKTSFAQGNLPHATDLLEKQLLADPTATAFNDLSVCYNLDGQYQKSIDTCTKGLSLAPDDVQVLATRAWAFDQSGNKDKAKADAQAFLAKQAGTASGKDLLSAGICQAVLDRTEDALALLTKAVNADQSNWYAYQVRGTVYARCGDDAHARSDFKHSKELKNRPHKEPNASKSQDGAPITITGGP